MISKTDPDEQFGALKRSAGWAAASMVSLSSVMAIYLIFWIGGGSQSIISTGPTAGELTFVLLKSVTVLADDLLVPSERQSWWASNKHPGEFPKQAALMSELASAVPNATICQLGFRAGHSSALLLSASRNGTLYIFDQMELPYSIRQLSILGRMFNPRQHFLRGNSIQTLPWFGRKYPAVQCDVFSVDTSPGDELTDLLNAIKLTKKGGKVLAVETFPGVEKAWGLIQKHGYIENAICDSEKWAGGDINRTWCYGEVVQPEGKLDSMMQIVDTEPNLELDKFFVRGKRSN